MAEKSYADMAAVTNRHLNPDYFAQLKRIAEAHPAFMVLREKDLPEAEYLVLAKQAAEICEACGTPLVIHNFPDTAEKLGIRRIHMPFSRLSELKERRNSFDEIGTSVHSVQDALDAEAFGCTYVFAGNIYETDCKKGLAGRGLSFLSEVSRVVSIPVYAIGGITEERMEDVRKTGAAGGCMMSGFMKL